MMTRTQVAWVGLSSVALAAFIVGVATSSHRSEAADGPPSRSPELPDATAPLPAVTHEQQERAIQETLLCLSRAGIEVRPTPGRGLLPTAIGYIVPANEDPARYEEILRGCRDANNLTAIEIAVARQQRNADPALKAQARERFDNCLVQRKAVPQGTVLTGEQIANLGKPGADGPAEKQLLWQVFQCVDDVKAQFGIGIAE